MEPRTIVRGNARIVMQTMRLMRTASMEPRTIVRGNGSHPVYSVIKACTGHGQACVGLPDVSNDDGAP
jgi:hypothetical protein